MMMMMMMMNLERHQKSLSQRPVWCGRIVGGVTWWWCVMIVLECIMTLATTTAVSAYVVTLSPNKHNPIHTTRRQETSAALQSFHLDRRHVDHHHLSLRPRQVFLSFRKSSSSSRSCLTCLAVVSTTTLTSDLDNINSTQQQSEDNTDTQGTDDVISRNSNITVSSLIVIADDDEASSTTSNSTSSNSSTSTSVVIMLPQAAVGRFRKTLNDMATAMEWGRHKLQTSSWRKRMSTSSSSSSSSSSIGTGTESEEVEATNDDQDQDADELLLLEYLLEKVQVLQDEILDQQKQQSPFEQLEQARLKLNQYAQQRQALQLDMVTLKEQYENQITKLQERLQQDPSKREASLIQQHEQEMELLKQEQQQERLANERRIGQIIAQGRHDVVSVESKYQSQIVALVEKLENTTMSLHDATNEMSRLQLNISQLQVEKEQLCDDVILLNATQYSIRKLVQRVGSLILSRTIQRARGVLRRSVSMLLGRSNNDDIKNNRDSSSSSSSRRRQQQQQEGKDLTLNSKYKSVALKNGGGASRK